VRWGNFWIGVLGDTSEFALQVIHILSPDYGTKMSLDSKDHGFGATYYMYGLYYLFNIRVCDLPKYRSYNNFNSIMSVKISNRMQLDRSSGIVQ
jgi:hypothetical protein